MFVLVAFHIFDSIMLNIGLPLEDFDQLLFVKLCESELAAHTVRLRR